MKIEITTTAKGVETANFLLEQAISQVLDSDSLQKEFMLSVPELLEARKFRQKLVKVFIKASKKRKSNKR